MISEIRIDFKSLDGGKWSNEIDKISILPLDYTQVSDDIFSSDREVEYTTNLDLLWKAKKRIEQAIPLIETLKGMKREDMVSFLQTIKQHHSNHALNCLVIYIGG